MQIEKEGENTLVSNLFKMNTYMASRDLERSYKQLLIIIVANCSI